MPNYRTRFSGTEPVIFKSVGRDKDAPPISAFQSGINGMLGYTNTIHDFDLARWLMRDEVTEVHAHTTFAIRPEIAMNRVPGRSTLAEPG